MRDLFDSEKNNYLMCYIDPRKQCHFVPLFLVNALEDLNGIYCKTTIRLLAAQKRGRKPGGKKRSTKSKYDNPEFPAQ